MGEESTRVSTVSQGDEASSSFASSNRKARLEDKFDLGETRVLLTGPQAIVRLAIMQHERDKLAGLDTAGCLLYTSPSPRDS